MATNLELYKFEDYIESAAKTILNNEGISAVTSREDVKLSTPYVEVQYNHGDSKELLRQSGSLWLNQRWGGNLNFTIVSDRKVNNPSHSTIRASLRSIFGNFSSFNSGSLMPYHTMVDLVETQTANEISDEDNKDISVINYSTLVDIKPTGWS